MEKKPDSGRKTGEKKSAPLGNQVVIYLMAVAVGTVFVWLISRGPSTVEIKYGDLKQLVHKMSPGMPKEEQYLDVTTSANGRHEGYRYSNLANLEIGPYQISGQVRQVPLDEHGQPRNTEANAQPVNFTTDKQPEMTPEFDKVLSANAFTDYKNTGGPGFFDRWFPLLAITALFGVVIFFMVRRL